MTPLEAVDIIREAVRVFGDRPENRAERDYLRALCMSAENALLILEMRRFPEAVRRAVAREIEEH